MKYAHETDESYGKGCKIGAREVWKTPTEAHSKMWAQTLLEFWLQIIAGGIIFDSLYSLEEREKHSRSFFMNSSCEKKILL